MACPSSDQAPPPPPALNGVGAPAPLQTVCPGGGTTPLVCAGKGSYTTQLPHWTPPLPSGWGQDVVGPCTPNPLPANVLPNQQPVSTAEWWGSLVFQASAGQPGNRGTACTYNGFSQGQATQVSHAATPAGQNLVAQPTTLNLTNFTGPAIRQQRVDYNPFSTTDQPPPNPSYPNVWQNWDNPPNPLNQQTSGWQWDINVKNQPTFNTFTDFTLGTVAVQEYGIWHVTTLLQPSTPATQPSLLVTAMRGSPYTWFQWVPPSGSQCNAAPPPPTPIVCVPWINAIGNLFNNNQFSGKPAPDLYTADDGFLTAKAQGTGPPPATGIYPAAQVSQTNVIAVSIADPDNPTWQVDYALFGPPGTHWGWDTVFYNMTLVDAAGNPYSVTAPPYVVVAALPQNLPAMIAGGTTRQAIVNEFAQYAFFYPKNNGATLGTVFTPAYNPATASNNVTGTFSINLATLDSTQTPKGTLVGLFPHQQNHLVTSSQLCSANAASQCPVQQEQRYTTVRGYAVAKNSYDASFDPTQPYTGQMKLAFVAQAGSFQLQYTFAGVYAPVLPFVANAWTATTMSSYLETDWKNYVVPFGPDTYNWGKRLSSLANNVLIAAQTTSQPSAGSGNTCDYVNAVEGALKHWYTADNGTGGIKTVLYTNPPTPGLFYYNQAWGSLVGFPAGDAAFGFGNQTFLNDHHFHWGYFIRASATLVNALANNLCAANADDTFGNDYGPMVEHLIRDIAADYGDPLYPAYRHFDPYMGHSSASGAGQYADGNNQESSSEAVNAWYALILWAKYADTLTGAGSLPNTTLGQFAKNLLPRAVYMYASETDAARLYYFNEDAVVGQAFPFQGNTFSNLYDDKHEVNGFGFQPNDIPEYLHIIEWLPFGGGSLYLTANAQYPPLSYGGLVCDKVHDFAVVAGCPSNPPAATNATWNFYWDLIWMYRAFSNAAEAQTNISQLLGQAPTMFTPDSGNTLAMMYHWTYTLPQLGQAGPPPIK
jgi:hypothetical protein